MGRRKKRSFADDDDGGDSSENNDDSEASGDDGGGGGADGLREFGVTDDDIAHESRLFRGPSSKRRNRGRTKEQALYGIWADDDSDDNGKSRGGRGGGGRRGGRGGDLSSRISFVSSSKSGVGAQSSTSVAGDDEDDDSDQSTDAAIAESKRNAAKNARRSGGDAMDVDTKDDGSLESDDDEDEDDDEGNKSQPRNREQEEEEMDEDEGDSMRPALGLGAVPPPVQPQLQRSLGAGIRRGRGGRSGIGSSSRQVRFNEELEPPTKAPPPKPENPFKAQQQAATSTTEAPTPLPPAPIRKVDKDYAAFVKTSKGASIAQRYLEKMGHVAGQGLGKGGAGIVRPIDVKLRPKMMGLGHKGFDERTEAIKEEQRLKKGQQYSLSDDEDDAKKDKAPDHDAWKKGSGRRRSKAQYKTAEQVLAEQELLMSGQNIEGVQIPTVQKATKIIDMTGPEARELTDVAQASYLAAMRDTNSALIELRHNLRMLVFEAETDLIKAGKALTIDKARRASAAEDAESMKTRVEQRAARIERVKKAAALSRELEACSSRVLAILRDGEPVEEPTLIKIFGEVLDRMQSEHMQEVVEYGLDEIVVSALLPGFRSLFGAEFDPLETPEVGVEILKRCAVLVRTPTVGRLAADAAAIEPTGGFFDEAEGSSKKAAPLRRMTPYETLLDSVWLPRVRAAINNNWSTSNPDPFIKLLEMWYPTNPPPKTLMINSILSHVSPATTPHLLPPWMYSNIVSQLLIPKLRAAIDEWDLRRSRNMKDTLPIHVWLFPWLSVLGDRFETEISEPVRRKFAVGFADWTPDDTRAVDMLKPWLEVFSEQTTTSLVTSTILPKLVATLRYDLVINPAAQDTTALDRVMQWAPPLMPPHIFSNLLETEFFTKWMMILHAWLCSDSVAYDEVTSWYTAWKSYFPTAITELPGVSFQFRCGLDLMNKAASLVPGETLPPPVVTPYAAIEKLRASDEKAQRGRAGQRELQRGRETAAKFRDLIEAQCAARSLFLVPAGKNESGKALYRVSRAASGGVLVWFEDAVVFLAGQGASGGGRAVSIDEMLAIASSGAKT